MRQIAFDSLQPHTPPTLPVDEVSAKEVKTMQKALARERNQEIARPHQGKHAPAVAKDASIDPSAFHMVYDSADRASLGYIAQMAAIGQVEDFHVVASCYDSRERARLEKQVKSNLTTVENPGYQDVWAEDHGEYTEDGVMVIPAMLKSDYPIGDVIEADRLRRFQGDGEMADFSQHGAVNERWTQQEALAAAMATGAKGYKMAVSYVEGGNMMGGKRPDGTAYALVGKDSLAVTKDILRQAGHSRRNGLSQIASDYGYKKDEVFAVEQPGEFHLDMAMALAGPGQVLLNDSKAVADLQKGWVTEHYHHRFFQWGKKKQLAAIDARAEKLAAYEALVEKDLRKAGLEVYRVPGCFPATKANSEMNFFNLRQGRNDDGETFAIALGGDERAEQAFAHTLLSEIPTGYQRIHFLDRELTPITLDMSGGIKCRTKPRQDFGQN
ncbi:hypothetical protein JST97_11530 [bacterium]|nr:hypothetical protein [bacterium]